MVVLAPATMVIVPAVSLPLICVTGAAILFCESAMPAAPAGATTGALPAVIMCPLMVISLER